MKIRKIVPSAFFFLAVLLYSDLAAAQEWTQANVPRTNWISVACSADAAEMIVAAATRYVYTSVDAGVTWNPVADHEKYWNCLTCSADGVRLAGQTFSSSSLYLSTNAGATWTLRTLPRSGQSAVAMSADGARLAVAGDGGVLLSSDFGETWRNSDWLPASSVISVACSADGSKMVAEAQGPFSAVHVSTNSGVTWWPTSVTNDFPGGVAISADGTTLLAASYTFDIGGPIYVSTNCGLTWITAAVPNDYWTSVTCSADGSRMAATAGRGVYISTNSGATWQPSGGDTGWRSTLASSADGCTLIMQAYTAGVYTYRTTPTPVMRISPSGGNIVLSWVIPSMPFSLQQSDTLDSGNWTDVATRPTLNLNKLRNEVTLPAPPGPKFYRLKAQ